MSVRLGQLLVRDKIISEDQLQRALAEQKLKGVSLNAALIELGVLREDDILDFLHKKYGFVSITIGDQEVDPKLVELVGEECMQRHQLIPVKKTGSTLYLAMSDPLDAGVIADIEHTTSCHVQAMVASESSIKKVVEAYFGGKTFIDRGDHLGEGGELELVEGGSRTIDIEKEIEAAEGAPVVKYVNQILAEAVSKGASDIHFEPFEKIFRVRFRIDGILYEIDRPPMKFKSAITSRLKIMSQMDIAERRLPQGGRFMIRMRNKEMDFRVSAMPTLFGEKVVMRLLDKSRLQFDLTKLGFEQEVLGLFGKAIHKPYGMILVTGPTGSGKTTTLYSVLQELNKVTTNICTAEDPVEFNIAGVNQVHIHEAIGLNFAAALREFLRQDPDIILVGEVRDLETAEIAVKAALTGHLVLSTLHTNDAPSTINRLLDMGVEPFLVSSSVVLVAAQRLVRVICPECKEPVETSPEVLLDLGVPEEDLDGFTPYRGKGCSSCSNIGYRGRMALYEVMDMTDDVKELTLRRASATEIKRAAVEQGMKTLRMSGITKIREGMTTIEEVLRVTVD